MRFAERIKESSPQAKILLGTTAAVIVVLLIGVIAISAKRDTPIAQTQDQQRQGQSSTPITARPSDTIPTRSPAEQAAIDAERERTGGGDLGHDHAAKEEQAHLHPPHEEDILDKFIPVNQLAKFYPREPGQMTDADYQNGNATAADAIRANKTGAGRDKYPQMFPTGTQVSPREVLVTNFAVDYANTTQVANHQNLYRTIVVWKGRADNVRYDQVRVAQYSLRSENGAFTPILTDKLPLDVFRSDPMINGVSIMGRGR